MKESPIKIANQIYEQATVPKMIAQCTQHGKTISQAIDSAAMELESSAAAKQPGRGPAD